MQNNHYSPLMKVSMTALALLLAPLTLHAQDKAAEASMGAREKVDAEAANQQSPGTTKTTDEASSGTQSAENVVSADNPATPLVPASATWDSFHGQLNAQKYSPLKQITADNVSKLKKSGSFIPAMSPMVKAIHPLPSGQQHPFLPIRHSISVHRLIA